eukprot:CAMPEP_0204445980 /NCGR_PEP_ID=MMETSP0470-20130426/93909_1 /ASSEMBLY_ACC=CAM_ASM_000385 /TAXON_ID=2969 /ORGANISM="Oxyrrhis marina" /LENGTH=75 /DNA_ID=CAMNT_0051445507 /DNA_START=126 /DNA_END=349 /DNA_ORIENTATION=-
MQRRGLPLRQEDPTRYAAPTHLSLTGFSRSLEERPLAPTAGSAGRSAECRRCGKKMSFTGLRVWPGVYPGRAATG